ncbi:hypothetical protein GCM10023148_52770 [Actinokineospora soli]
MKVLLSFSFAVRLGFWMLLAGFTAGLLVGLQTTAGADAEPSVDPRSIGAVHCLHRSGPCTPTSFSS